MQFDDPDPLQLDLDLSRKNSSYVKSLTSVALTSLFSEEGTSKEAKKLPQKIAKALSLSSRYRREKALELAMAIVDEAGSISPGHQGYAMKRLSSIAEDSRNSKLRYYWLATAYRLLRHDPKLGIFAADCAFQVSEYPQLTGKLLANRQIWATRALAIADNDIANFDWIPKALCTLAYYQENNGLIEMANQTYLKAISLTERQSPPRLFSICLLHLKRAIILGELKQYDEEILSFENAKGTWVKLREGSGKDFLRKQLERALTKSVQAAKLRNES